MRLIRALLDRVFPRGAITLSILSLGYFGMGLVRNRVFANTFGAGPELDAYNAAFRIPEIALDILVASGLSAPFVPIFIRLLEGPDDGRRAEAFGRTVLTVAVAVMAVTMGALLILGPWIAENVFRDFDGRTRALYVELFRINCLAQVIFAASITLGEVLVAHRRFLFYALAPILYTTGIVLGTRDPRPDDGDPRLRLRGARRRGRPPRRSGRSARPGRASASRPPSASGRPSSASSSG